MPRERGVVLIWTAILLAVLVAFLGLLCDWAYVLLVAQQLQNTADAAALAAAQKVRVDQAGARSAAQEIALANFAGNQPVQLSANSSNAAGGDIVMGRFQRDTLEFTPDAGSPNAVKVVARRTASSLNGSLPLIFAPAYGVETSQVSRSAIAMIGGGTGAGLVTLNPSAPCSLNVQGNFTLNVDGGAIQVNSSNSQGACANGNPVLDTPLLNVNGGYHPVGNPILTGELNEGAPQVPDPLGFLPEPNWSTLPPLPNVNVKSSPPVTINPGYYPTGLTQSKGSLTLRPGVYILDGAGLNISGSANFTALGVLLFVKGTGKVDLTGGGNIRITPPDPDNPDPAFHYPLAATYEGVSIFQSRSSTVASRITGTNLLDLEGSLYFPSVLLNVTGSGNRFGNQLIAGQLSVQGSGTVTIHYDGRFPAAGSKVFLVK